MFDMGETVGSIPEAYKVWPSEVQNPEDWLGAVDADLLPYIIGFTVDEYDLFKALDKVATGACSSLAETTECQDAIKRLDWTVNEWLRGANCKAAKFFITDSKANFRNKVAFSYPYKGDRNNDKPPFYLELRQHLVDNYAAIEAVGEEADDLIVQELYKQHRELEAMGAPLGSLAHQQFSTVVAISIDKDIKTAVGWHYNPSRQELVWVDCIGELRAKSEETRIRAYEDWPLYKGEPVKPDSKLPFDTFVRGKNKGKVKTKRVNVGFKKSQRVTGLEGEGLLFFYSQILTGDSTDCYKGCKGVGAARAYELLHTCRTEEEMYSVVLEQYEKAYGQQMKAPNWRGGYATLTAEQLMTEQGRLAFMQTEPNEVWNAKIELPLGTDKKHWRL